MQMQLKIKKKLPSTFKPIVLAVSFWLAPSAWAQLALVIGNGSYKQAPLANPANDARAISKSLKESGFSVTEVIDQDREQMKAAVLAFSSLLQAAKQPGLFYFAGHGVQLDWRNYLLPVNQPFNNADDVRNNALDITDLTKGFQTAKNGTNIIILDACRDNPFGSNGTVPKGLTQMDAPTNTFLAYATAPGQTARDAGTGANGLYTENLLKEITREGAKIEDVFKRVRLNVRLQSNGEQIPWETTSLENDFYFRRPLSARALSDKDLEEDFEAQLAQWQQIKLSRDVRVYEDFLGKYPSGKFAELAHHRLERMLAVKEQRDRDITQLQKLMMATANSATLAAAIPANAPNLAQAQAPVFVPAPAPVPAPVVVVSVAPAKAPAAVLAPAASAVAVPAATVAATAAATAGQAVAAAAPVVIAAVTAPAKVAAPAVAVPAPIAPAPVAVAAAVPAIPAQAIVKPSPPVPVAPAPAAPAPVLAAAASVPTLNPAADPVQIAQATNPLVDAFAPIRASGILPGWRVGDALTYRTTQRFGAPVITTAERRAVQVLEDKIITALGNEYDLFGNPLKVTGQFEVLTPPQWFIHEYYVGKRWSTRYKRQSLTGAGLSVVTADVRVVSREQVSLPAGKFDAFKFKVTSYNGGSGYNNYTEALIWIDTASSKMVASETRTWDTNKRMMQNSRVDLMAFNNASR